MKDPTNSGAPAENRGGASNIQQGDADNPIVTVAGKSAALQLVDLAERAYKFGCTKDGMTYAVKPGHHVALLLRGDRKSLRAELATKFRKETGKVAAQQALADALLALEGQAQDAEPREVHLRVAQAQGAVWIDRGDVEEHVIKVTGGTWEEVTTGVPVLFRRTELTEAMPKPERGGDLAQLWPMLNVVREDRALVVASLVAALGVPECPHPVIAITGNRAPASRWRARFS